MKIKRFKLKKWCRVVLYAMSIISILALCSDCRDLNTFITIKICAFAVLMLSSQVLIKEQ